MQRQADAESTTNRSLPLAARLLVAAIWLALGYYASTSRFSGEHTGPLLAEVVRAVGLPGGAVEVLNFGLRKTAHLCEYAVLAAIIVWLLAAVRTPAVRRSWFWITLAIIVIVAACDEFHQSFEPGRDASLRDVFIDICGGLAALVPLAIWKRRKAKGES